MADELSHRVESVRAKSLVLAERVGTLVGDLLAAQENIRRLERQVADQQSEIESLRSELTYRKLAASAAGASDDNGSREEMKALLAGLVREIDSCINDLTH